MVTLALIQAVFSSGSTTTLCSVRSALDAGVGESPRPTRMFSIIHCLTYVIIGFSWITRKCPFFKSIVVEPFEQ